MYWIYWYCWWQLIGDLNFFGVPILSQNLNPIATSAVRNSGHGLHQHRAWWCCTLCLLCKATLIHNESIFLAVSQATSYPPQHLPTNPTWRQIQHHSIHKKSGKVALESCLDIHLKYIPTNPTNIEPNKPRWLELSMAPHHPEAQQRGPAPQPKAIRGAWKGWPCNNLQTPTSQCKK